MYKLKTTTQFKKDLKKYKTKKDLFSELSDILKLLKKGGANEIPLFYRPHRLKGNWHPCFECHVKPDVLLIWLQNEDEKEISLIRLGSHSEIF